MFGYAPTTRDESGMIRGQGITNSAQIMGEAKVGLVDDIGSALVGLAGAYGEMESNKAKGRAFKDVFKVVGPTMGMSLEQLEGVAGGKIKSDMDWFNVSETISPYMPALINLQLGQDKLGVQRNQPYANAAIKNAANIAGHGGPGMQRGGLPPAGAIFP